MRCMAPPGINKDSALPNSNFHTELDASPLDLMSICRRKPKLIRVASRSPLPAALYPRSSVDTPHTDTVACIHYNFRSSTDTQTHPQNSIPHLLNPPLPVVEIRRKKAQPQQQTNYACRQSAIDCTGLIGSRRRGCRPTHPRDIRGCGASIQPPRGCTCSAGKSGISVAKCV